MEHTSGVNRLLETKLQGSVIADGGTKLSGSKPKRSIMDSLLAMVLNQEYSTYI